MLKSQFFYFPAGNFDLFYNIPLEHDHGTSDNTNAGQNGKRSKQKTKQNVEGHFQNVFCYGFDLDCRNDFLGH